jgi:hypothetical protein
LKRIVLIVLALVLALLVLCLPVLLRLDKYRAQIASSLSQQMHRKVVVGRLEAVLFPPAMRLREIAVMSPTGDSPLLQIDEVLAPLAVSSLFRGKIVPQSLILRAWNATVRRRQNGTWAWDEWMDPTAHTTQSAGWPLGSVTLNQGEVHVVDPYGPGPQDFVVQIQQGSWEIQKHYFAINGTFTSLPSPVSFLFQGSGQVVTMVNWSGMLSMSDENREWKIEIKAAQDKLDATGHADAWRLDNAYAFLKFYGRLPVSGPTPNPAYQLQAWNSRFNWQSGNLSFAQDATVAGGRSEAKGTIKYSSPYPFASVDLAVQGVKLQPVEMALFGNAPLDGIASGIAHLDLQLSSAPWSSLNDSGALEVKDGKYLLPGASLKSLAKAKTMKYLMKKYPNFDVDGLPLLKARVQWQLKRGLLTFDDAFANLGDIQVAGVGSYDTMRDGVDATLRVQVHEKNPALIKELPSGYVDLGVRPPRIQAMHGRLVGAPGEWRLRAVRVSKVPPAVMNKLSKTIRQK